MQEITERITSRISVLFREESSKGLSNTSAQMGHITLITLICSLLISIHIHVSLLMYYIPISIHLQFCGFLLSIILSFSLITTGVQIYLK